MLGSTRRAEARAAALEARIRAALQSAGALLRLHDSRLELRAFDAASGVAQVEVAGGCPDCELRFAGD